MKPVAPLAVFAFLTTGTTGCGGSSYGHSPMHVPTDRERPAVDGSVPYDPAAMRSPGAWATRPVTLFGIVEGRSAGTGGRALLRLAVRALEPRNLCKPQGDDESCRVTVGDRDLGVVWALVALSGDDDVGPRAVGQRSLLRVVGLIGQDVAPADGAPIVHATWYRQWPVNEYLTPVTAAALR